MKTLSIEGGYSVCGGLTPAHWYAGVLVLEDVTSPFAGRDESVSISFHERVETCRGWENARARAARKILLVQPTDEGHCIETVDEAEHLDGPICPKEETTSPALAWTAREGEHWHLKLLERQSIRTVARQTGVLRFPQVAVSSEGVFLACERDVSLSETEVAIFHEDGSEMLRIPGRRPKLIAMGTGLLLMVEQADRNSVRLRLISIRNGKATSDATLHHDDYTMNADVAWCGTGDAAFVAAETCSAHGHSSQLGSHREIRVWRYSGDSTEPMDDALPVERRAFMSLGPENLPPIAPSIFTENGKPAVAFKQFRYKGFKTFGWDVFLCRQADDGWEPPVRLSSATSVPDSGYCVMPHHGEYVAMYAAMHNDGGPACTQDHRVEIAELDTPGGLEKYEVPEDKQAPYLVPAGHRDIALPPPDLSDAYPGRTLIWGDLHQHTAYSKCMPCTDGSPDEAVRYLRDVLGCRVFTFADHTPWQSHAELTWCLDRLEMLAGDYAAVLYGAEPSIAPGRHTNFYAKDRDVFERLCSIAASHRKSRVDIYRHIREKLPPGSVLALRHFHGRYTADAEMLQNFEPRLEVAMEAMQGRCNAMLEPEAKAPLFPHAFLNHGRKIGLVGGSDHYRSGSNHFCLTGFWVKEPSPEGVWEAILNRYTFGVSDAKIAMAATCGDAPAGAMISLNHGQEMRIRLNIACARTVRRATLIRDGEVLPWTEVGSNTAVVELLDPCPQPGHHWYVPTVQAETAYGSTLSGYGHTSPFFVHVGQTGNA